MTHHPHLNPHPQDRKLFEGGGIGVATHDADIRVVYSTSLTAPRAGTIRVGASTPRSPLNAPDHDRPWAMSNTAGLPMSAVCE